MTAYDDIRRATQAAEFEHIETMGELLLAQGRIVQLEAELAACKDEEPPPPPPPPPVEYDAFINEGDSLNTRLAEIGPDKTIKVTGTFNSNLRPFTGQRLFGPFKLVGGSGDACNLKTLKARNVSITDFEIDGFSGRGIVPWFGSRIRQGVIHDLGENAMTGSYENAPNMDILIEDMEVFNCGDPSQAGNSAGGFKFTRSGPPGAPVGSSITMRRIYIHNCEGNGLWFDISCAGELLEDIEIHDSSHNGFRYEICMGPVLINRMNTHDNSGHGFFITSSAYVEAHDVATGGNGGRGILLLEEERAILPTDVEMKPMGTHEGFKFRDIAVLNYHLNGDELQSKPNPNVTLEAAP
jgi:hypothetical protein